MQQTRCKRLTALPPPRFTTPVGSTRTQISQYELKMMWNTTYRVFEVLGVNTGRSLSSLFVRRQRLHRHNSTLKVRTGTTVQFTQSNHGQPTAPPAPLPRNDVSVTSLARRRLAAETAPQSARQSAGMLVRRGIVSFAKNSLTPRRQLKCFK